MDSYRTGSYRSLLSTQSRDTMSHRAFMLAISIFTTLNIVVAAVGSSISHGWEFSSDWHYLLLILGCFVVSLVGTFVAQGFDDPTTSIIGGFICAIAIGVMVGPMLSEYSSSEVFRAFALTTGIVMLTGIVGMLVPKNLSMWATPLFALLVGLIGLYLILPLLVWAGADFEFSLRLLDILGILLFSALMVYDLNKAKYEAKTLNNAIDTGVSVFLNFANIFIRLIGWGSKD